jgi:hypothetical protein
MELVPGRTVETMKTTKTPHGSQLLIRSRFSLLPAAFLSSILLVVPAVAQQQTAQPAQEAPSYELVMNQFAQPFLDQRHFTMEGIRTRQQAEARQAHVRATLLKLLGGRPNNHDPRNAQANRLAHLLRAKEIGPGQRIGLLIERSPAMFVELLGIQKNGAAYVPLDPAYPAERVRATLEAAGITLLVSQEHLLSTLPE